MSKQNAPMQVEHIDPAMILADDNCRYGLKETGIVTMMQSIMDLGGIQTPIKVVELNPPQDGKLYRVSEGHYRHAAATRLSKDQWPGIEIPAVIVPERSELEKLDHQLSENRIREDLSPIDEAAICDRYMKLDVSRTDIRNKFSGVRGGRKGTVVQPVSNSWLNMRLSFLTLPKAIQDKIHDGRIPVTVANLLVKVPAEKRAEILADAEAELAARNEAEEKEETKFLEKEAKEAEARDKVTQLADELAQAQTKAEEAAIKAAEAAEAAKEAFAAQQMAKNADEKKAAKDKFDTVDAAFKAAKKEEETAQKEIAKKEAAKTKATEHAAKLAEQLKASREAAKSDKKKATAVVSAASVSKAAAAKTVGGGMVHLTYNELKQAFVEIAANKPYPIAAAVGTLMRQLWQGTHTTKQTINMLAKCTGEVKDKPPKA